MSAILEQAKALPVSKRLKLLGDIWDSIEDESGEVPPLTRDQKKEIDRRLAHLKQHPESTVTWDEVKRHARSRHGR